jgi:hypothetical protein
VDFRIAEGIYGDGRFELRLRMLEGTMNGPMFLAYVKQYLAPALKRDDIVAMDNLPERLKRPGCSMFRRTRRPQSDRAGFQQSEGVPAQGGRVNNSASIASDRTNNSIFPLKECRYFFHQQVMFKRERNLLYTNW